MTIFPVLSSLFGINVGSGAAHYVGVALNPITTVAGRAFCVDFCNGNKVGTVTYRDQMAGTFPSDNLLRLTGAGPRGATGYSIHKTLLQRTWNLPRS